ncbi:MAG TPA: TlpA disulfide reductase family protein [Kofleriaceae bacterium]|jgi:thiol-disulfide isomerase/thioredoxin|nr:TlpA disulfide reductase family protein [Kofleriaceae bacterium]
MPRLALFVIAVALATGACKKDAPVPPGDIAARLALPTLAGAAFDPSTLDGKPTVVMFWRPTCPHCLEELPDVARACKDKGANAVAVMVVGSKEAAERALTGAGWEGAALVDDGALRKGLDIKAVPYTLVLRPDGTAARAFVGRQSYGTITAAIASAR